MGSQRLTRLALLSLGSLWGLIALGGLIACTRSGDARHPVEIAKPQARHVQIVHAMTTPHRRDLVERFRTRNPVGSRSGAGTEWTVNEEALALSLTVVDPFAGFLRRARRGPGTRTETVAPIGAVEAALAAREFVKRNADLLGLPRHLVGALAEHVRSVDASDRASPRATHAVHLDAPFASKGYEGFHEIDNAAEIDVFVDDDGEVSSVVNLSRIHPHLTIDTKPELRQDDPRVIAKLVGRTLFAFVDDPRSFEQGRPVRELRRIPLGTIHAEDVTHLQLVIHVSPGPQLAWLTYRLGYFVQIAKSGPSESSADAELLSPMQKAYFFRYVVDADTGDVIEDARAPITPGAVE